jgi:hypothetical protein
MEPRLNRALVVLDSIVLVAIGLPSGWYLWQLTHGALHMGHWVTPEWLRSVYIQQTILAVCVGVAGVSLYVESRRAKALHIILLPFVGFEAFRMSMWAYMGSSFELWLGASLFGANLVGTVCWLLWTRSRKSAAA